MTKKSRDKIIRQVHLNNKSRKGWYWYINEKGKPNRYYKVKEDIPLDIYNLYYDDKYETKSKVKENITKYETAFRKGTSKTTVQKRVKKYVKKLKRRKSITQSIKKGISSVVMPNALHIKKHQIKKKYFELFEPLVLDSQILDLLVREDNMQKIRSRFEHRIKLYDKEDQEIAEVTNVAEKTIEQVIEDLKKSMKYNQDVKDFSPKIAQKLKEYGSYQYSHKNNGKLHRVELLTIFRKGR